LIIYEKLKGYLSGWKQLRHKTFRSDDRIMLCEKLTTAPYVISAWCRFTSGIPHFAWYFVFALRSCTMLLRTLAGITDRFVVT